MNNNRGIPLPGNKSFDEWVRLLNAVYPDQLIPDYDETRMTWQDWAKKLRQLSLFNVAPLPTSTRFPDHDSWKDWVPFFIQTMS